MGNMICSIDSRTDFPPLNQLTRLTRLNEYREDRSTEEDTSYNSEEDSDSSNNSYFVNISFQEALTKEKAQNRRKNFILNLVTLRKKRTQTAGTRHLARRSQMKTAGGGKLPAKMSCQIIRRVKKTQKMYVLKEKV